MELIVLGCSGSVPGPHSPSSGYLLRCGDTWIVLDLGSGTMGTLQRWIDPFDLDAVLLTHLHPDHCADFAPLTVYRRYRPNPPRDPAVHRLPVYGPPEASSRLSALYAPNAAELADTDLSDVYEIFPPPVDGVRIGPFEIRAVPMDHVCPSWGFRVEAAGRVFAYTGDTGPCDGLADLAADADVLLAEASWADFPEQPDGVHLSGWQAGVAATTAGARRLLITHVQPWSDADAIMAEARKAYGGPVELVQPDGVYPV